MQEDPLSCQSAPFQCPTVPGSCSAQLLPWSRSGPLNHGGLQWCPIPSWELSDFPNLVSLSFDQTPKPASVMRTLLSPAFSVGMQEDRCKMCFGRGVLPSSSPLPAWDRESATHSPWEHDVCSSLAQHFLWDNPCGLSRGAEPLQWLQEALADSSKQVAEPRVTSMT